MKAGLKSGKVRRVVRIDEIPDYLLKFEHNKIRI